MEVEREHDKLEYLNIRYDLIEVENKRVVHMIGSTPHDYSVLGEAGKGSGRSQPVGMHFLLASFCFVFFFNATHLVLHSWPP